MRSGLPHTPRVQVLLARFHIPIALFALASLLSGLGLAAGSALAQASAAGSYGPAPTGVDVYGGYAYFQPFGSDIGYRPYETIAAGGVFSVAAYFNRTLGLQVEGGIFLKGPHDNNCVYTAQVGPILRRQRGRVVPFVHALGGAAKVGGPANQTCTVWGWGVTGGGGVDYLLPYLNDRFAFRVLQTDFNYSHVDNGVYNSQTNTGGLGEIYNVRVSTGLVFRFAGFEHAPQEPITLSCSTNPSEIVAGDLVTLNASASNLRSADKTQYVWESTGGKIPGTGATERLNTTGLAPGTYTVGAKLLQGDRKHLKASCTSSFLVLKIDPPTLSCSSDRAAINSGDPVVITSIGLSPQNRPLTYTYSSTAGQITGNGPSAALSTAGTSPGTISITCGVVDDRGNTASAHASVVVATPIPPAPVPQARNLCSLSFERDRNRPNRVDNEAKGCLDDIALTLNRDPASKLVIVGNRAAPELKRNGAERAMNAAQYLVDEKGIDRTRIELRVGDTPGRSASTILVPAGASVNPALGTRFDASAVRRNGQPYGKPRANRPYTPSSPGPRAAPAPGGRRRSIAQPATR